MTFCKCEKRKDEGSGPACSRNPSTGKALKLQSFSCSSWGVPEKNPLVKLNGLNFIGGSGWQDKRELGQTKQLFPGEINDWKGRLTSYCLLWRPLLSDHGGGVFSWWTSPSGILLHKSEIPSAHQWRILFVWRDSALPVNHILKCILRFELIMWMTFSEIAKCW